MDKTDKKYCRILELPMDFAGERQAGLQTKRKEILMKRSLKIWLLFLVLITGLLPLTAFAQENSREKLNFNQGWKFIRGNIQEAIQVDYPMEELERWESVNLPHTVREEPYINSGGINYQGEAMYRKHFSLPKE